MPDDLATIREALEIAGAAERTGCVLPPRNRFRDALLAFDRLTARLDAGWQTMDDEAKAWALGLEIRGNSVSTTNVASIMAFAAEVRRDERERALLAILRLPADDAAQYEGRRAATDAIRALSDAPGGPDPTVTLARLFATLWRKDVSQETMDLLFELGFYTRDKTGFPTKINLTPIGLNALALAEAS